MRVLCCFVCAMYLFNLAELQVSDHIMTNSVLEQRRTTGQKYTLYPRKGRREDATVYIGFASDPFGPSTRFIPEGNQMQNISFPFPSNMPRPSYDENAVDTGQSELRVKYTEPRSKRGVFQLYNMVKCATGCNPLSYKGYGCFCGFLGSGHPVDGIDRCCKKHDWCYDNARCPPFFEYLVPYLWKCYKNRPLCAIDNGDWGGPNSCARRLCECDRVLSECLSRYTCPRSRALCHSSPWRLLQNAFMIF